MSKRLVIILVCALVLSVFPCSAWAVRAPLASETAEPLEAPSSTAAEVPAALAEANVPAVAWARMVEQIRAEQAANGCATCERGGADYAELKKLLASDGAANDDLGSFVAIHGDTVVVGAPDADGAGTYNQGAAYIFQRNWGSADNWGQVTKLTASDGVAYDHFGASVAIWGDTVVVGAYGADIGSNNAQGAAYLFQRNHDPSNPGTPLADNWGQVQKLTASDGWANDDLGTSVAIWGDTVLVGAYGADIGANFDQGSVYIFQRNYDPSNPGTPLADNWGQIRKLSVSDGAAYDHFGYSVAIWGGTVVVGAEGDDVGSNVNQGSAYVFQRNYDPSNPGTPLAENWGQVKNLIASDGAIYDHFGYSAAIWGDMVLVGAYWADVGGDADQGAAYVFRRNLGGADNWGQVQKLTAADGAGGDHFGWYVDIWVDTIVVGAYGDDVGANAD